MAVLPSSLALTSIADGSLIVAADHRNNYAAIQTEANALLNILNTGAANQFLQGVGTSVSFGYPPGYEFGTYTEFTSSVSITATSEATANTIVTAPAITLDGATPVYIEFFAPTVQPAALAGGEITFCLYDGASSIGFLGDVINPAAAQMGVPVRLVRRLTPAASAKTYSVRASRAVGNGTVVAGTGVAAAYMPGFIRIFKA